MSNDLIARLREWHCQYEGKMPEDIGEAANLIESLRQQLADMQETLKDHGEIQSSLCQQLEDARRTAEYWKAEHLAGNKQLAEAREEIKELQADLDAALKMILKQEK